ncbi:MAG: hypothetical protein ACRBFS_02125 [Aureispira sp.]
MMKVQEWVESFFSRLETTIELISKHPLIDKVKVIQFKGLTDVEIDVIETEINERLDEIISENDVDDVENALFKFSPFMRAFYKRTNGLNVFWHTVLIPSDIQSERLKNQPISSFVSGDYDYDAFEGKCALLPLDALMDVSKANFFVDVSEYYQEDLAEYGELPVFLDYFETYYDTCLVLSKDDQRMVYGEDHSASYTDELSSDFVTYMEYQLATFFSANFKHKGLGLLTSNATDRMDKLIKKNPSNIDRDISYLLDFFDKQQLSINDILRHSYLELDHDLILEDKEEALAQLSTAIKQEIHRLIGVNVEEYLL